MSDSNHSDANHATLTLTSAARGDANAEKEISTLLYDRLRLLAGGQLRHENLDHTLQPTALVHEAYIRLIDQTKVDWKDRSFFLGVAAREMRRILIDHARARLSAKRGGGWGRVLLEQVRIPVKGDVDDLDLGECLEELTALHERQGRIVELRFFGGLGVNEVAEVLGISPKTVEKDWRMAKAWLYRRLNRGAGD